jgi:hydroxylamine reductase (hybrid-cluster protein)
MMQNMEVEQIIKLLSKYKFPLQDEKETQVLIENVLSEAGIKFKREYKISDKDQPDFLIDSGIVLVVKIKGRPVDILCQCQRYCQHNMVSILILITNKLIGFPSEINGKPCYVINMGKSWM